MQVKKLFDELKIADNNRSYGHENYIKTKAGQQRLITWSNTLIKDDIDQLKYLVLTGIDITERKQAELELKRTKNNYQSLLEVQNDLIFRADLAGNITYTNDIFHQVVKTSKVELIGKNYSQFLDKQANEKIAEAIDNIQKPPYKTEIETKISFKQGIRWIDLGVSATRDDTGEIVGFQAVGRDITALKNAIADAKQANRAKSGFLANMSHEIRTPLNAVIGFTEILEEKIKNEKQQRYLKAIKTASDSLLNLINDILDMSKIEAGRMETNCNYFSCDKLAKEMREIFFNKAEQNDLEFILEIKQERERLDVYLDEVKLRQVLLNLLSNALKFTHQGQIKLLVDYQLDDSTELLDLKIVVEDTGIGIAEFEQEKIFESFTQRKGQDVRVYNGTGLGLAISKELVEMMGGEILLESQLGQGSRFILKFSHLNYKIRDNESIVKEVKQINRAGFNNGRILVVDDVKLNRDFLKILLNKNNLEIIEAENGKKAVAMALKYRPDLILMDLKMPEMDGYQALEEIRDKLSEINVVALTASATEDEKARADQVGFDEFLTKPIKKDKLFEILNNYLSMPKKNKKREDRLATKIDQEVIDQLKKDILPKLKQVEDVIVINEIKDFSVKLKDLAAKYQVDQLVDYANNLSNYVKTFDLIKIREELASLNHFLHEVDE